MMAVWKKGKTVFLPVSLVFVLVFTFCFPSLEVERAAAETNDEDYGFMIHLDKISGRINLIGLRPGIILDTQVAFTSARIYGLTLTKSIRTPEGDMVLTIESGKPDKYTYTSWLKVRLNSLNIGGLCWPERFLDVCLSDVTIDAKGLQSHDLDIPNLDVQTSFDPSEVSEVESLKKKLAEQDDEEQLEKLILAIDEAEEGELSSQDEAFEKLQKNLPDLQNETEQIDQLLEQAGKQREQAENMANSLEEIINEAKELIGTPELSDMIEKATEQNDELTVQMDDFTVTLEEADDLLQKVQDSLKEKQKLIKARFEYLEELKLDEWSERFKKAEEARKKLDTIEEKVEEAKESIVRLKKKKQTLSNRISSIGESIEDLKQIGDKQADQKDEREEPDVIDRESGQENSGSANKEAESERDDPSESDTESLPANASSENGEDVTNDNPSIPLQSDMDKLLNDMDDTNKDLAKLFANLKNEWIDPVQEILEDPLEETNLDELKSKLDEARKDDVFKNKLNNLMKIKEIVTGYKSSLQDQTDKLMELRKNKSANDVQVEWHEIESKIILGKDIHQEIRGRIDDIHDIQKTLDELFDRVKQNPNAPKEGTSTTQILKRLSNLIDKGLDDSTDLFGEVKD